MLKLLSDLRPGEAGTVCKVEGDKVVRRRMLDMGLTLDMPMRVVQVRCRRFHRRRRRSGGTDHVLRGRG